MRGTAKPSPLPRTVAAPPPGAAAPPIAHPLGQAAAALGATDTRRPPAMGGRRAANESSYRAAMGDHCAAAEYRRCSPATEGGRRAT